MRWRCFASIALTTSALCGLYRSDVEAQAVEPGDVWWCYTGIGINGRALGSCQRSEVACYDERRQSQRLLSTSSTEWSVCTSQARAAVITFYDVMRDYTEYVAFPTTADCERAHAIPAFPDKQASECAIVGKVASATPNRKLVAKGRGWWCGTDISAFDGCTRRLTDCRVATGLPGRPCRRVGRASVFTRGDEFSASPTADICEGKRAEAPKRTPYPSICATIP